jgi:hypothetical protein
MKRTVIYIALFLITIKSVAQNNKESYNNTRNWRYEVEGIGEGKEGTYLVKIWSYSKKPRVAIEQAKKNAIHAIIFQGYIGNNRISSQPPICSNLEAQKLHEAFFNSFFSDKGSYMKYISISSDGVVSDGDRIKIGKEYKIGIIVSIRKDLLRKDLESNGIIKSFGSGF